MQIFAAEVVNASHVSAIARKHGIDLSISDVIWAAITDLNARLYGDSRKTNEIVDKIVRFEGDMAIPRDDLPLNLTSIR